MLPRRFTKRSAIVNLALLEGGDEIYEELLLCTTVGGG